MKNPIYRTVPGHFLVGGYHPDGDTLRFVPDDLRALGGIENVNRLTLNKDGSITVRLEGIDAPELHFQGWEQPLGEKGRDALLRAVAGREVKPGEVLRLRGTILTASADTNGRAIAYVFGESVAEPTANVLARTANASLLSAGFAYPLAYDSQPEEHRALFRTLAHEARNASRGIWKTDRTTIGFTLRTQASIGRYGALIYPKLFRRCLPFVKEVDIRRLGFRSWLATGGAENDTTFVRGQRADLVDLLEDAGGRVRVVEDLLDLVFAA